jgi:hypothetical protein
MSLFASRHGRKAFLFVVLIASCAQAQTGRIRRDDYVGRAKQLIRTFYPDLNGYLSPVITEHNRWFQKVRGSFFSIGFYDLNPKGESVPCWCSAPALHGLFLFNWTTREKYLMNLWLGGPVVDSRVEKVAQEVKQHPEWSDAEVIVALNRAGARFGPDHKADFLRALPLAKLEPFVGKLKIESADFFVRYTDDKADIPLIWHVQAKRRVAGREVKCSLSFDPFEGRLKGFYSVK